MKGKNYGNSKKSSCKKSPCKEGSTQESGQEEVVVPDSPKKGRAFAALPFLFCTSQCTRIGKGSVSHHTIEPALFLTLLPGLKGTLNRPIYMLSVYKTALTAAFCAFIRNAMV
jgi:hypothetical protein